MICLDIGPLQICTGEWPNENTTRKSKCHHYVPSLCNQVYFAVSESREIWAYAPERSKIKYPDISSKEEAKREEKKKNTQVSDQWQKSGFQWSKLVQVGMGVRL